MQPLTHVTSHKGTLTFAAVIGLALVLGTLAGCGEPIEVASITQADTTAVVTVTNVAVSITGPSATGTYTYSNSQGLPERHSAYSFERADDAAGTNRTLVGILSQSYPLQSSDENKYLRFCVLGADSASHTSGSAASCSPFQGVGRLATLYDDANYGGSYVAIPYENMSNGVCIELSSYGHNDTLSSMRYTGRQGYYTWLAFYANSNCSGARDRIGAESNSVGSLANLGTVGMDNKVSSVRVIWATEVSLPMNGSCSSAGWPIAGNAAAMLLFNINGALSLYNLANTPATIMWYANLNGGQRLCFQGDNNLVIYKSGGGAAWASGSVSSPGRLVLQVDCNLVIYDGSGVARWASNTTCW